MILYEFRLYILVSLFEDVAHSGQRPTDRAGGLTSKQSVYSYDV